MLDEINIDDYYFLGKSKSEIINENKLPLGFNIPVFYINSTRCNFDGQKIKESSEISSSLSLAVNDLQSGEFKKLFPNNKNTVSADKFYSGEADMLFSDTSEYFNIRSLLPGQYRILTIDSVSQDGVFDNLWSLSKSEDKKEKAAQRFLEFMLSDNAQDYFYIRNANNAMPINKNALNVYKDVYQNDIANTLENLTVYSFDIK